MKSDQAFNTSLSILLLSISLLGSVRMAHAQRSVMAVGGVGAINPSVRSLALGEATVALDGYAGAAHINPATIGKDGFYQFYSEFMLNNDEGLSLRRNIGSYSRQFMPGLSYRNKRWAGLVSINYLDDELGRENNRNHLNIYMGGNYEITGGLRVGAGLNYYRQNYRLTSVSGKIDDHSDAVSIDLGSRYEYRTSISDLLVLKPSVGVSLTDFGSLYHYDYNDQSDPQLMMMRGGVNLTLESFYQYLERPLIRVSLLGQWSKDLVSRDEQGNTEGPLKALVNSWGTYRFPNPVGPGYESYTPWQQIHRQTGVEVSFLNVLQLRWGRYKQQGLFHIYTNRSTGFGLDLFYLAFDYARIKYETDNYLDERQTYWQFTVRIPFGKHPENFWPTFLNLTNRGGPVEMKR